MADNKTSFLEEEQQTTAICVEKGEQMAVLAKDKINKRVQKERAHQLKGNIRVLCRVRPVSTKEASTGEHGAVVVPIEGGSSVLLPKGTASATGGGGSTDEDREFNFDTVFGPESTQKSVYGKSFPGISKLL
jgi:kinesin family protein C1